LKCCRDTQKNAVYDAVVINRKAKPFADDGDRAAFFAQILRSVKMPKMLFVGSAQAGFMPNDAVIDCFDVVFKREPHCNYDLYQLSEENKAKIMPTMISCPFVHAPRDNWLSRAYNLVRPTAQPWSSVEVEQYEVGFSGADAAAHSIRRDVWKRVVDEGFSTIGGLQPNPNTKIAIPEELHGPRFKGKRYRDALCAAKINLALPGIGEYTFRHQELLYLGKFMLSHNSIDELELPMPLTEGKHYVSFSDVDDMVEKIRYYLAHEDERLKIAAAGKALFDEYYDSVRHGQDISAALQAVRR
jgi:hypothetical protein